MNQNLRLFDSRTDMDLGLPGLSTNTKPGEQPGLVDGIMPFRSDRMKAAILALTRGFVKRNRNSPSTDRVAFDGSIRRAGGFEPTAIGATQCQRVVGHGLPVGRQIELTTAVAHDDRRGIVAAHQHDHLPVHATG